MVIMYIINPMSVHTLNASLERAQARLGPDIRRQHRSDRGMSRMDRAVTRRLAALLSGQDRPSIAKTLRDLAKQLGDHLPPARASVYKFMAREVLHYYRSADLPAAIQAALYNLPVSAKVPGHQLVFYCFCYGDLSAMSFAAGLPWIDLYQAARMRGWRARSRGLLESVMEARHI